MAVMRKYKNSVLIVRLSALGDVAMTLPVIYSVAAAHPDTVFCVLTRPFFSRLFIARPKNVSLVCADFNKRYGGFWGMIRLLRDLNRYGFGMVADLHNVLRSWLIDAFFMLKGKRVVMVDKQRSGRKAVIKSRQRQTSYIKRYADVFQRLGLGAPTDFRRLPEEGLSPVPLALGDRVVGIAPFARYATKTYPLDLMEQVIEGLSRRSCAVLLFGAKGDEKAVLDSLQRKYSSVVSVAGRYSIEEELALMSRLRLMVSMDSANQHLASLVGTRVLTLWGGTTPSCGFAPYGQSGADSVCLNLPCQPCSIAGEKRCQRRTFDCMRRISPECVVEIILSIIGENENRKK